MIPVNIIQELLIRSKSYQKFIFSLFSLKFHALGLIVEDIKFKQLDTRILDWLQSKSKTTISVTHEDIATALGTSRVVISRVLKDLENKNFLKLHRKEIELL